MTNENDMTVYAAVHGAGVPSYNVFGVNREAVEVIMADRRANGEAWADERLEEFCCLHAYNARLREHRLSEVSTSGWFRLPVAVEG